jgi:GNAT superfamily N-acetyltransferase
MNILRIVLPLGTDQLPLSDLLHLWNEGYTQQIVYHDLVAFCSYLDGLENQKHYFLVDPQDHIQGWTFSFDRENERWFALIVSENQQGQGYGRLLLNTLKSSESILNGWVIDHPNDKRANGQPYRSPLAFYRKCGFDVLTDQRLETGHISAVKIRWVSDL